MKQEKVVIVHCLKAVIFGRMRCLSALLLSLPFFFLGCKSPVDTEDVSLEKEVQVDSLIPPTDVEVAMEVMEIPIPEENDYCLPEPDEQFLTLKAENEIDEYFPYVEKGFEYDEVYLYLYFSIDSTSPKKVLRTDEYWGPIYWEQTFVEGITYRNSQTPEVGGGGELFTKCTDKSAFLKVIEPVISYVPCEDCYDPNQIWKEDSTLYEPADADPGCYYTIERDSLGYFMMHWYCGC